MKRILTLLALVTMTITANAVIQSGYCGNNVHFTLRDEGTLVISFYDYYGDNMMQNYGEMNVAPWDMNKSKIHKVEINDGVGSIGDYAFSDCPNLTSVTINSTSLTVIGSNAFSGCYNLTTISTPDGTKIGRYAFKNCSKLNNVVLKNPRTIEEGAFYGCVSLNNLTIKSITPPTVGVNALTINDNDVLHIYKGCKLSYITAEGWKNYKTIVDDVDIVIEQATIAIESTNIRIGETETPSIVSYSPDYATNSMLRWTSDNPECFSVNSETGTITGLKEGYGHLKAYNVEDKVLFDERIVVFKKSDRLISPVFEDVNSTTSLERNHLYLKWKKVKNASKYEVRLYKGLKYSDRINPVSIDGTTYYETGYDIPENAEEAVATAIIGDECCVDFPHLDFNTHYFATIRALSRQGEQYNSEWGGGGISLSKSNETYAHSITSPYIRNCISFDINWIHPTIIKSVSDVTPNSLRIHLNRYINTQDENINQLRKYYNFIDNSMTIFKVDYITIEPTFPIGDQSEVQRYDLSYSDWEKGYLDISGLKENTRYTIKAVDSSIPYPAEAVYDTYGASTIGGKQELPILLKHDELIESYSQAVLDNLQSELTRDQVFAAAEEYDAAPISPVLHNYMFDAQYAEGQTFYLEGGKTYYIDGQDITCKGFTLATDPDDVAQGKRARVICGIGKSSQLYFGTNGEQSQGLFMMFMFGRQPEAGERGEIYMKKLAFENIDFDNPTALNFGDYLAGAGDVAGNYFFNMYSNGMAVTLDSLVIKNCKFKRFVRGFIREQGANYKVWKHVLIDGNWFYDCGFYNWYAGGYSWIAGSGSNAESNLYHDFKAINNTFYDSPFPAFFSEENTQQRKGGKWNITFSNNTLINFNTRASGAIFKMRNLPNNSVYNVENNLIVLTKAAGDQRVLSQWGADIRYVETLSDGTDGHVTLNFNNNWSTNNDLTSGSIFSANPWTATSNNFGKLVKENWATLNGTLEVQVADVSATELFTQPNPPHVAQSANDQHMHRADAIDGTATTKYNVNLYYKNKSNDIVRNNVGAPCWIEVPSEISIISKEGNDISISQTNNAIRISNVSKGLPIHIYTTAGMLCNTVISTGAVMNIDMSNFKSGMYVVKAASTAQKILKE